MEIGEIKDLIELLERSSLTELVLERGGEKLILRRQPQGGVAPASATTEPSQGEAQGVEAAVEQPPSPDEGRAAVETELLVRSPIVGTFYRRPSPEEDPYVEVGDRVDAGDTVCIVEAMKVMNEVRTERAGTVKRILVEDATPVEYGQLLIAIDSQEG